MNNTLVSYGRDILKELLPQCSAGSQLMFKRMYCHQNLDYSINDAVDQMDDDCISRAIEQVEPTLKGAK